MRKSLLTLLMVLCLFGTSVAAEITLTDAEKKFQSIIMNDVAVASTATVNSSSFNVLGGHYHGMYVIVTGSAPDVKLYIQHSYTDSAAKYANANTTANFASISSATTWIDNVSMAHMLWGRVQIIGQAGNGADTKVTIVYARDTKTE